MFSSQSAIKETLSERRATKGVNLKMTVEYGNLREEAHPNFFIFTTAAQCNVLCFTRASTALRKHKMAKD